MSITKEKVVDQITVTENGIILYREATSFVEDGTLSSRTASGKNRTAELNLRGRSDTIEASSTLGQWLGGSTPRSQNPPQ